MALTNLQLVLLDNLIYLGKICEVREKGESTVDEIVSELLNGDIDLYWKDELKKDQSDDNPGQCLMGKEAWLQVLNAIAADPVLMGMTISDVVDADTDPSRADTNSKEVRKRYQTAMQENKNQAA